MVISRIRIAFSLTSTPTVTDSSRALKSVEIGIKLRRFLAMVLIGLSMKLRSLA